VESEEDILHIRTLPSFGGRLSQSAVELLVSYLTAPYIRIPLILNFFATPEHINALGVKEIQVLHSFEWVIVETRSVIYDLVQSVLPRD